jgi:hypothetical protein
LMKKKHKSNVIGLRPIPPDAVLEEFINQMLSKDIKTCNGQMDLLMDAIEETEYKDQPRAFAYAKLLNFLASETLSKLELVHLCAAAMWRLNASDDRVSE